MNKILAIILFTSVCFGWSGYGWENHSLGKLPLVCLWNINIVF